MSVVTGELKAYQSANMPEDDATTSGGAINTAGEIEFTEMAANDTIEAVSDNAADTMNITITGRDAGGAIVTETKALNGTTPISLSVLGTIERILKIVLAAAAAGNVTVRRTTGPTTIKVVAPGITSVRRLFYDSASQAAQTVRYEKIFLKNENASSFALSNAQVTLTADPSASIRIGCAPAVDDSGSVANRLTSPGVTFVDDNVAQGVPGGTLNALSVIGVWIEMTRGAAAAAVKSTFTTKLDGTTA